MVRLSEYIKGVPNFPAPLYRYLYQSSSQTPQKLRKQRCKSTLTMQLSLEGAHKCSSDVIFPLHSLIGVSVWAGLKENNLIGYTTDNPYLCLEQTSRKPEKKPLMSVQGQTQKRKRKY